MTLQAPSHFTLARMVTALKIYFNSQLCPTFASAKEVAFCVKLLQCISTNLDELQLVEEFFFYFWHIEGDQSRARNLLSKSRSWKMVQMSKYPATVQLEMSCNAGKVCLCA